MRPARREREAQALSWSVAEPPLPKPVSPSRQQPSCTVGTCSPAAPARVVHDEPGAGSPMVARLLAPSPTCGGRRQEQSDGVIASQAGLRRCASVETPGLHGSTGTWRGAAAGNAAPGSTHQSKREGEAEYEPSVPGGSLPPHLPAPRVSRGRLPLLRAPGLRCLPLSSRHAGVRPEAYRQVEMCPAV